MRASRTVQSEPRWSEMEFKSVAAVSEKLSAVSILAGRVGEGRQEVGSRAQHQCDPATFEVQKHVFLLISFLCFISIALGLVPLILDN